MREQHQVARRALLLSLAVLGLATAPMWAESPKNAAATGEPAIIAANVPADAEVWFGDQKMTQRGTQRRYTSPALPAEDNTYYYDVRVRWMENGQPVERTRTVYFRAGDRVNIQFRTSQDQAAYRANPDQRPALGANSAPTVPSGTVGRTSLYPGTVAPADNHTTTIIPSVPPANTSGTAGVVNPAAGVIAVPVGPPYLPPNSVNPYPTLQTGNPVNQANPGVPTGFQPSHRPVNPAPPMPSPTAQPAGPASNPNLPTGNPQGSNPTTQPPGPANPTPNR